MVNCRPLPRKLDERGRGGGREREKYISTATGATKQEIGTKGVMGNTGEGYIDKETKRETKRDRDKERQRQKETETRRQTNTDTKRETKPETKGQSILLRIRNPYPVSVTTETPRAFEVLRRDVYAMQFAARSILYVDYKVQTM